MKKALKIIVPIVMIVAIIASIGWYLFVYDRDFTRDMLISQARYQSDEGNAEIASWFYGLAYNYTAQDEDIAIELANQYKDDGNYTKAEFTLTNAIADGGTVNLYIALCKTYVEQDKLLDAVNMLNAITDPTVKAEIEALRPLPPVPSHTPGFFNEYIDVDLSAEDGTVYYSTTVEYPSTNDEPFTDPISLPEGQTRIYAVCVGDNGLVSSLATLDYTIGGVIEKVEFTDPEIEKALRTAIGFDETDTVYTNDLWDVKEFTVPTEATSVADLKYLPYLEQLTMQDQNLDNLDVLATLSYLQAVDLSGCRFPAESLRVLANLPSLKRITLNDCGLSTIADLEGARTLTHLYLSNNTLRNLQPISNMATLVELILDHNAIVDLSALSGLVNLEKLDVSYNSLTTLAPLAACVKLNWLDAGNNSIATLDTVDKFTGLKHLALDTNQISDISILASCTTLAELSVAGNEISDISMLSALTALETLNFSDNKVQNLPTWPDGSMLRSITGSNNQIKSINSLANLKELSYVYMDYNKLKSIDAIANCYHLVIVNVYGNDIDDVSALTDRDIIVNYDPT